MKRKRKRRRSRRVERDERQRAASRATEPASSQSRTKTSPERAVGSSQALLGLQQSLGNQAVQRLLHSGAIQAQSISLAPDGGAAAKSSYDMGKAVSNAKEIFYSITEPKLAKVISKFKFTDEDGNKLAGQTKWNVVIPRIPKSAITKKRGMWVVDPIPWTIKSITVQLPKWQNFSAAKDADKTEWARFIKCTRIHEQGHVDRVRKFMNKDMPQQWKSASGSTPKALQQRLKELVRLVRDRLKKISEAYDAKTSHGATQGATLRPPTSSP